MRDLDRWVRISSSILLCEDDSIDEVDFQWNDQ